MLGVNLVKNSKRQKLRIIQLLTVYSLLLLSAILYTVSVYKRSQFGDSQIDEILFYASNGLANGQSLNFIEVARDHIFLCLVLFFLLLIPVIDFYRNRIDIHINLAVLGNNKTIVLNPSDISIKFKLIYAFLMLIISILFLLNSFHVISFIKSHFQTSTLYEQHYVNPKDVNLEFPKKKRNLIYIYAESLENILGSREHGGQQERSKIPELEKLALDKTNVSFSNQASGLGGAMPISGTTWTVAGMVSQSAGIPLNQQLFNTETTGERAYKSFLPGAYDLGDVLAEAGYNQTFLMGSEAKFGGRNILLKQHGNYKIIDYIAAKQSRLIAGDYGVWWGYEDKKLFEFAREEAKQLSTENKPFNISILTADTHFTDGYLDPTCKTSYKQQYDNVYACSSRQITEFVRWVQQQPFGKDTTIVISGDHLGMQTAYYDKITQDKSYQRTIYNAIINPAIKPVSTNSRLFSTVDMYPTTLSAMGVKIPGDRLALGTDLFSSKPTLLEQYGSVQALNQDIEKRSDYYDKKILTK